jgi:P27 family predicted phage terminase small subunit
MLRGNPSKKNFGGLLDEFRPEVEIPDCPSWCWAEAKKEWKRITPELDRYGLVAICDRSALTLYCQAWAEYVWAKKSLARAMKLAEEARSQAAIAGAEYKGGDGFMIPTANGSFTYSPYWVAANRASEQVDKYLASFGLSPSSRGRVSISDNRQASLFGDKGEEAWDKV